jgi:hypothetical protein
LTDEPLELRAAIAKSIGSGEEYHGNVAALRDTVLP